MRYVREKERSSNENTAGCVHDSRFSRRSRRRVQPMWHATDLLPLIPKYRLLRTSFSATLARSFDRSKLHHEAVTVRTPRLARSVRSAASSLPRPMRPSRDQACAVDPPTFSTIGSSRYVSRQRITQPIPKFDSSVATPATSERDICAQTSCSRLSSVSAFGPRTM